MPLRQHVPPRCLPSPMTFSKRNWNEIICAGSSLAIHFDVNWWWKRKRDCGCMRQADANHSCLQLSNIWSRLPQWRKKHNLSGWPSDRFLGFWKKKTFKRKDQKHISRQKKLVVSLVQDMTTICRDHGQQIQKANAAIVLQDLRMLMPVQQEKQSNKEHCEWQQWNSSMSCERHVWLPKLSAMDWM